MSEARQNNTDRQRLSGNDAGEQSMRIKDTQALIDGLVGRHERFFADPSNRIQFMLETSPDGFLDMTRYVNAKLRGEKPRILRLDSSEQGASLRLLHTPDKENKPEAFRQGYAEIQNYLHSSEDDIDTKIKGAAMAIEALIIWVHPFNDGNGRTSRFMARMVESGVSDVPDLISQTVSNQNRGVYNREKLQSMESILAEANNPNIMLDDEERSELRKQAAEAPNDTDAISLSIRQLLDSGSMRQDAGNFRKG